MYFSCLQPEDFRLFLAVDPSGQPSFARSRAIQSAGRRPAGQSG